ncbi:MAG: hypothetical protein FWG85_07865 [Bacteroidetes bacterium]|nr:hypothetical protein [Bacteroidota bacterium]
MKKKILIAGTLIICLMMLSSCDNDSGGQPIELEENYSIIGSKWKLVAMAQSDAIFVPYDLYIKSGEVYLEFGTDRTLSGDTSGYKYYIVNDSIINRPPESSEYSPENCFIYTYSFLEKGHTLVLHFVYGLRTEKYPQFDYFKYKRVN